MSTNIKTFKSKEDNTQLSLTRFSGGVEFGTMLLVTISNGLEYKHINLTKKQVARLAKVLKNSFNYEKYY